MKMYDLPVNGLVLNKKMYKYYEPRKDQIENVLTLKIRGIIPFDLKVHKAIAKKEPVVLYKPHARASVAYKDLSATTVSAWYFHSTYVWLLVMGLASIIFAVRWNALKRNKTISKEHFKSLSNE